MKRNRKLIIKIERIANLVALDSVVGGITGFVCPRETGPCPSALCQTLYDCTVIGSERC